MRNVFATLAAWIAAALVVIALQSGLLAIDPNALTRSDPSRLIMILLLFSDLLGGFVAGLVAAFLGKRGSFQAVWFTLILLTLLRFVTVFFESANALRMVSVMSVFGIPFAILLGGRIFQRSQEAPEETKHHVHPDEQAESEVIEPEPVPDTEPVDDVPPAESEEKEES